MVTSTEMENVKDNIGVWELEVAITMHKIDKRKEYILQQKKLNSYFIITLNKV